MPGTENQIDARFYELIHRLVGRPQFDEKAERRGYPREPFSTIQRIAPYDGKHFPKESEFFEIRCHDLTPAGFSFLVPTRLDFSLLVAAFGTPPEVVYVSVETLRSGDVLLHPSGQVEHLWGRPRHVSHQGPKGDPAMPLVLVGCRFVKRLEPVGSGQ